MGGALQEGTRPPPTPSKTIPARLTARQRQSDQAGGTRAQAEAYNDNAQRSAAYARGPVDKYAARNKLRQPDRG